MTNVTTFQSFNLPAPLLKSLEAMKFTTPTPIQALAIPVAMRGKDIIGCAQTGTGKTAAFGLPMITRLLQEPGKALILVPTRELAMQVAEVIEDLTVNTPKLKMVLLIGGQPFPAQERYLRENRRIIVATPGRMLDHLTRRNVRLDDVKVLVLDEADRMLDMGFRKQIDGIMRAIPAKRQTLLFSATEPDGIAQLCKRYMHTPERVMAEKTAAATPLIDQTVVHTTNDRKPGTLKAELDKADGSTLVFVRTKRRADRVARTLDEAGYMVTHIHGDRSQSQRIKAINGFRSQRFNILVATDIAARGIDISHISTVINYDLPDCEEDYIHRIGRTGRAGKSGKAVSILTNEDKHKWMSIQRYLTRKNIAPLQPKH